MRIKKVPVTFLPINVSVAIRIQTIMFRSIFAIVSIFLFFCVSPVLGSSVDQDSELNVPSLAHRLEQTKEYSYTIRTEGDNKVITMQIVSADHSLPGTFKQLSSDTWEADSHFRRLIVPFILNDAFEFGSKGLVDLTISAPWGENSGQILYSLTSKGLPEAMYALKLLAPAQEFSEWMKKNVPVKDDIEDLEKLGDDYWRKYPPMEEIERNTQEMQSVIQAAG